MSVIAPPNSDVDPFSDEILGDPEPFWQEVRRAGPAVRLTGIEGHDVIAVGRDQHVRAILSDNENFINSRGSGIWDIQRGEAFRPPALLTESDEPMHGAYRAVMTEVISPKTTRRLRQSFSEAAEEIVDRILDLGEFDAQVELAENFPLRVVPDAIMGAPREGRQNLLRYATFLFESMGPRTPRVARVLAELGDVPAAVEWVATSCQRENVSPDSFGASVWAAVDRGQLAAADAPNLVRSLVGAGIDTTIHSIATTLQLLVSNPSQWRLLREQPGRAKFAYDEALRRRSVIRTIYRTPSRDLEFEGMPLREGQKVMLLPGSANLDPVRWGDTATAFDITRDTSGHLSFGWGIHQCVGAAIARLEADVILSTLARRVKTVEFAGSPVPLLNNFLQGWASLPVYVKAA